MTIEVNGIKYQQRNIENSRPKMPKGMATVMAASMMFGDLPSIKEPGKVSVDIVKEYGLIQQKKSSLSAAQRGYVVNVFERNYKKIDE